MKKKCWDLVHTLGLGGERGLACKYSLATDITENSLLKPLGVDDKFPVGRQQRRAIILSNIGNVRFFLVARESTDPQPLFIHMSCQFIEVQNTQSATRIPRFIVFSNLNTYSIDKSNRNRNSRKWKWLPNEHSDLTANISNSRFSPIASCI